jgi:hypothetical protein
LSSHYSSDQTIEAHSERAVLWRWLFTI